MFFLLAPPLMKLRKRRDADSILTSVSCVLVATTWMVTFSPNDSKLIPCFAVMVKFLSLHSIRLNWPHCWMTFFVAV